MERQQLFAGTRIFYKTPWDETPKKGVVTKDMKKGAESAHITLDDGKGSGTVELKFLTLDGPMFD